MKDGYYLSAYFEISKLANLYCCGQRHDNCAALWYKNGKDITLVHYWEFERRSGIKQQRVPFFDLGQSKAELNILLKEHNLSLEDIVEIWGIPELNENDNYLSKHRYPSFQYHSVCHLASALFMDTNIYKNENILAFTVDGGPDNITDFYEGGEVDNTSRYPFIACYSSSDNKRMEMLPVFSPGLIWMTLAHYFKMREGSLMALTSASESEAYLKDDMILVKNVGDFTDLFQRMRVIINDIEGLTQEDAGTKFNYFDERFNERENKISMVMKIVQEMSYQIMDYNIKLAVDTYKIDTENTYLAMAGGFALNCPCNTYLLKKYKFKGFIAPPCVSDSGMALGIGLYSFYHFMDGDFNFQLKHAYYGDTDDLTEFLRQGKYASYIEAVEEMDYDQAVADLEKEPLIWFEGKAEIGPRALGARSILGDPRKQETKDRLNEIKQRQWWRPVAPIVLADQISEWFTEDFMSPYMLHASKMKASKRKLIPAIIHFDGSARLQSIDYETGNPRLYRFIQRFFEKTNIPIVCNTSLNDKGEPIINTIEEAFNFALRKKINVLYINGKRLLLKNHELYQGKERLHRKLHILPCQNKQEYDELIDKYRPKELDERNIYILGLYNKELKTIEKMKEKELHQLNILYRYYYKTLDPFKKDELNNTIDFNNKTREYLLEPEE